MADAQEIELVFEPQDEDGYHVYAPDLQRPCERSRASRPRSTPSDSGRVRPAFSSECGCRVDGRLPSPPKRLDQALAGDDRLAGAHAGRGIERRITPLSSDSPSSRRPST
jgi:hypothetical protein